MVMDQRDPEPRPDDESRPDGGAAGGDPTHRPDHFHEAADPPAETVAQGGPGSSGGVGGAAGADGTDGTASSEFAGYAYESEGEHLRLRSAGPKRWVLISAIAVSALALTTTAAALSVRGSHPAANAGSYPSAPVAPDSSMRSESPAASGSRADDPSSVAGSPSAVSRSATTATSTPTTTASKPPASTASTTSTTSPAATGAPLPGIPTGTGETDCENVSHETPQDLAVKFTGMTRGTQHAFLTAQAAAKTAALTFTLNSGYRTAAYQQRIFDCWVQQLGSAQAARKFALPPNQSAHVAGYAMDIAPQNAAAWLDASAGKFGLCRRYADEPWHFEYQAGYKTQGCPALLPQPY